MKKILAILLAAMMVFALAACDKNKDTSIGNENNFNDTQNGGENNNSTHSGENNSSDAGEIDFGAILSGNGSTDVIYGRMDEVTKQKIIADGKAAGYDISFETDGSMTVVDTDGTIVVQKPNGTWVVKSADGVEGQLGGDWPDNEFTVLVPKPDFELYGASSDVNGFSVIFKNATVEQIRDYAAKVRAAGFNVNVEVEDQEIMGMVIYSFTAENSDGYSVEIFSASGSSGMHISK